MVVFHKVHVCINNTIAARAEVIIRNSSPDIGCRQVRELNHIHIKASDQAQISGSALERLPQVVVVVDVGVDDAAISEDDFKILNIVTPPSVGRRKEGIAAARNEPAGADAGGPSAGYSDALRGEDLVHGLPGRARGNGRELGIRVISGCI